MLIIILLLSLSHSLYSLLLFMQNKLNSLNPALIPELGLVKEGGLLNIEMLRSILNPEGKQHPLEEQSSARKMAATPG